MPEFSRADIKEICRDVIAEEKENSNWYSNKDLFDMISSIKEGQQSLTSQVEILVDSINNQGKRHESLEGELCILQDKVKEIEDKVDAKDIEVKAKTGFIAKIKDNLGWIFGTIATLLMILDRILQLIKGAG